MISVLAGFGSSVAGALTETTQLDTESGSQNTPTQEMEESSTRSSTPSSARGLMQKVKRNTVAPINEEGVPGQDSQAPASKEIIIEFC